MSQLFRFSLPPLAPHLLALWMCLAVCCPARGGGLVGKLILLPTVEERPKKKICFYTFKTLDVPSRVLSAIWNNE